MAVDTPTRARTPLINAFARRCPRFSRGNGHCRTILFVSTPCEKRTWRRVHSRRPNRQIHPPFVKKEKIYIFFNYNSRIDIISYLEARRESLSCLKITLRSKNDSIIALLGKFVVRTFSSLVLIFKFSRECTLLVTSNYASTRGLILSRFIYPRENDKFAQLTGDAGAEGDEGNRGNRVLDAQGAAKVGCHVSYYRRHHTDPEYADDKAQVTTGDI